MIVVVGAIGELERSLIIERVRAGMRNSKLEGRHIGRKPLDLDRQPVLRHCAHGQSLTQIANSLAISGGISRGLRVYSSPEARFC